MPPRLRSAVLEPRIDALRTWVRAAFALALLLATAGAIRGPERAGDGPRPVPSPYGTECHCALQAASPAAAPRSVAVDSWKASVPDLAIERAAAPALAEGTPTSRSRRGPDASTRPALHTRGYDATAPPASPLA